MLEQHYRCFCFEDERYTARDSVMVGRAKKLLLGTCHAQLLAVTLVAGLVWTSGAVRSSLADPTPNPVILDTDIGGDVDDVWALSFLLASPELDLKLIVSDSGNTVEKGKIIAEILQVAGRDDTPIGIGVKGTAVVDAREVSWAESYRGEVHPDGVQALIDTIMSSEKPITLIAIGPVPNLALALEREPRIVDHARLVVMGGCIGRQEAGEAGFPEHNVVQNPQAAQKAYGAEWDVTMTPIDTAGKVVLQGEHYALVRDAQNPLARRLMEHYHTWNRKQTVHARDVARTSSILWDTVAVYLAFDESYCRMRDIRLRVTPDGITQPCADGKLTHVAIEWKNLEAFHELVAERIARYQPAPSR